MIISRRLRKITQIRASLSGLSVVLRDVSVALCVTYKYFNTEDQRDCTEWLREKE
jgi:hypothetical protein